MGNFWTDGTIEPKRQNRWLIQFEGIETGHLFFATKVGRPEIEVTNKEHKYLNHTFNYPGRATWKPVNMTMVDLQSNTGTDGEKNTMKKALQILQNSGYIVPNAASSGDSNTATIAKSAAIGAASGAVGKNGIHIRMVDANGAVIEKWTLKNAFITSFKPSELSYEGEDLAVIDLTITYDYCEYDSDDDDATAPLFVPGPRTF